jgi:hypothetical protein
MQNMQQEIEMIVLDRAAMRKEKSFADRLAAFVPDTPADETAIEPATERDVGVFARQEAPVPFEAAGFRPPAPDLLDAVVPPRIADYSWHEPLAEQVAEWLKLFVEPSQVVELRALNVPLPSGAKLTWSGFYDWGGLEKMAADAEGLTADAEGVYFTLNPLDTSLLARRYNKAGQAKDTAADTDVLRRRWLLVDADPVRKSGISATNEEKQQAWATMRAVHGWLAERGWPEPILADSGNGYHLLYRIDLRRRWPREVHPRSTGATIRQRAGEDRHQGLQPVADRQALRHGGPQGRFHPPTPSPADGRAGRAG